MRDVLRRPMTLAIRAYRFFLSPYFGNQCRFYPTCSVYALEAIDRHGSMRGGWLALRRIGRCHPLHEGGIDHVPLELGNKESVGKGATL